MAKNVTLSGNQQKALTALLAEKTVRDAAANCNLSEKTLYRYLADEKFRKELHKAHGAIFVEVSNRLTANILDALDKLWKIVETSKDDNIRRLAINDWLKHALKIREVEDLEARIAILEECVG